MNQQRINSKTGVLRVVALALMALLLVAGLTVIASADDPTPITVNVADLDFSAADASIQVIDGVITKTYDAQTAKGIPGTVTVKNNAGQDAAKVTVSVESATWDATDTAAKKITVVFSLAGADKDKYVIGDNNTLVFPAKILPKVLGWANGSATASTSYAIGKSSYAFDAAGVTDLPALDKTGLSAALSAEVDAITVTVDEVTSVNASAAGTYNTKAKVKLSNSNFTAPAVPVTATVNKVEITSVQWNNTANITYGDPRNVTVTGYDAAKNAYEIYQVEYPADYGDVNELGYTLSATLLNANFTEIAGLEKTKIVMIAPKNYGVTMKDQKVLGDGKTPYTIGVESETMPDSVRGKIVYTVDGASFVGTASAGTYVITATLPGGNYTFTSGGKPVTELHATLTITVDHVLVSVKDGDSVTSNIILTSKKGLDASVSATAQIAPEVKLPKGTKYAQSFQILLSGASDDDSFTLIIPLSYEVYKKGCEDLAASSLYVYDAAGNPVTAISKGYKVTAAAGYYKLEGVKGDVGSLTVAIAPQYSNGGIGLLAWIIIILVLVVILLVVMFFIGRKIRKSLDAQAAENAEETTEAVAEETAEEVAAEAEAPVEEEPAEEPAEEIFLEAEEAEAEMPAEEQPVNDEPAVETLAAVAEEAPEAEEEAPAGIPAHLQTKNGGLLYIDTRKKPDLYQEMLALEAAGQAQILYRYRKSYQSKLVQADGKIQDYYSTIKNALLHYRGVKARKSWNYEAYNCGRTQIAKIIPQGKTVNLYLGIDPAELAETKYGVEDVSEKKKFEATPLLVKIRGDRKLKFALELIEKICGETLALKPSKKPEQDYKIEYMTQEQLLDAGLVKLFAAAAPIEEPVAEPTEE